MNERLGKEEFDCLTLDKAYDCGCGDERNATSSASVSASAAAVETTAVLDGGDLVEDVERREDDDQINDLEKGEKE